VAHDEVGRLDQLRRLTDRLIDKAGKTELAEADRMLAISLGQYQQ
jgi:hypothetical protein